MLDRVIFFTLLPYFYNILDIIKYDCSRKKRKGDPFYEQRKQKSCQRTACQRAGARSESSALQKDLELGRTGSDYRCDRRPYYCQRTRFQTTLYQKCLGGYLHSLIGRIRLIEDGDTVNIDYVGSIDGVEFEGGNTKGNGADLVIGSHTYIDDFEEQLIGHHPGDSVDVTVTFPEDYGKDELNGKEALFKVTVNGIYK